MNPHIYILHVYIPPMSSKVLEDRDFDFFEEIEKGIEKYSLLGNTYITGDMNSRCSDISDTLMVNQYLDHMTEENVSICSVPIRHSNDKIRN